MRPSRSKTEKADEMNTKTDSTLIVPVSGLMGGNGKSPEENKVLGIASNAIVEIQKAIDLIAKDSKFDDRIQIEAFAKKHFENASKSNVVFDPLEVARKYREQRR